MMNRKSATSFPTSTGFGHPGTYPKNPVGFFWVNLVKNPGKKPAQNKQILMSYSTVIKKFFTRLKDVNI